MLSLAFLLLVPFDLKDPWGANLTCHDLGNVIVIAATVRWRDPPALYDYVDIGGFTARWWGMEQSFDCQASSRCFFNDRLIASRRADSHSSMQGLYSGNT